jgi:hypothetical protein
MVVYFSVIQTAFDTLSTSCCAFNFQPLPNILVLLGIKMKKSSSVTTHTITLSRNAVQYVVDKRTPCNIVEWKGLGRGKLLDVDIS